MLKINAIHNLHALEGLRKLPDESVDMVITSPPYWNLRDYGNTTESIWDETIVCKHQFGREIHRKKTGGQEKAQVGNHRDGVGQIDNISRFCIKCGAWKGQLGLEPDFYLYLKHLLDIFDEIKRVLKKTGTCWVNFGDTYGGKGLNTGNVNHARGNSSILPDNISCMLMSSHVRRKWDKCLLGLPERFMIGMIDRGWTLRNKIVWHKPNQGKKRGQGTLGKEKGTGYFK